MMADVSFNHFPLVAEAMHKAMSQVVRKTALDIQANAQNNAPVDTGFLKSSIYTVTSDQSTYGQADAPPKDAEMLTEVDKPDNDLTAFVAVGANYGIYVELGTRHTTAQPYFNPAVDAVKPSFEEAMSRLEDKMVSGI